MVWMWDQQGHLNCWHSLNPQPGDYWHEMLVPQCVVVFVDEDVVGIVDKTKDAGPGNWTWDLSSLHSVSREEFRTKFEWDNIPGHWARVEPRSHAWVPQFLNYPVLANSTLEKGE